MTKPTSDPFDYEGVIPYFPLCTKMTHRFHNLDEAEALSTAMGALLNAYRYFMEHRVEGNFARYACQSIQHALIHLYRHEVKHTHYSLERMGEEMEGYFEIEALSTSGAAYESLELLDLFVNFLETLDEANRLILYFRSLHGDASIEETAHILSKRHEGIPATQGGLTKRLKKLQTLYHAYREASD